MSCEPRTADVVVEKKRMMMLRAWRMLVALTVPTGMGVDIFVTSQYY